MSSKCIPNNYLIKISTNFENFTFVGKTITDFVSKEPIKTVILNAADLEINSCKLQFNNKEFDLSYKFDHENEEVQFELPEEISGNFTLTIDYEGKIQENLKGLYQTHYKVGKDIKVGGFTQFETEDARRMFPCLDEPGIKAKYELEVTTDNNLTVISNMPIVSQSKSDSKQLVKFDKTPKMSSYLLFLGIADFESIKDNLRDIEFRVFTHPGLVQYGKSALEFGMKSLDYCEKYFNIPYPLPKMDLISTPDFAAGAMENWGAITFRETALLTFPNSTTKSAENRIKGTIAHEITHQWFGDLVSPAIWKYIWLNESFATFFASKIVDHYYPDLKIWDNPAPMSSMFWNADAYHETVPIEIAEQKRTSYNVKTQPIIYGKGGAVLRMLEDYVGIESFQKGLQLFLRKHQYDVATSDDLWSAIEEPSNKPVIKIMKSWILQPGYPLVTVKRQGTKLILSQKRFTFLENDDSTLWLIPISLVVFKSNGEQVNFSYLLDSKEGIFDIGFEFKAFKLNLAKTGFYHVSYDPSDLEILGSSIKSNKFSPLDCRNLVDDETALFKAGKISLDDYLKFISNFTSENYHSAISVISDQYADLAILAEGSIKEKLAKIGISFHETILDKIGYTPKENEFYKTANLRNTLLLNAGYLGSSKVIKFCLQEFQKLKEGKSLPPDSLDAILAISARETNELNWFLDKFESAKNEADIITYGTVLGDFKNEEVLEQILNEIVFTKIPLRNRANTISRLCNNPFAIGKMWNWYIANLDNFGKMPPGIHGRSLNSIISNSLSEKADIEKFFSDYGKTNRIAKITSEKALETLEINLQVKKLLK